MHRRTHARSSSGCPRTRGLAVGLLVGLAILLALPGSPAALADTSWLELGVGTHTGFSRGKPTPGGTPSGPVAGATAQVRVLRIFGAELGLTLAERAGEREFEVLLPTYRVSALVVIMPKEQADLFLRVGLGANESGDLFDPRGATSSYHLGPGLELILLPRLFLSMDLLFHLPGVSPVRKRLEEAQPLPRIRKLVNMENFEICFGLRARL